MEGFVKEVSSELNREGRRAGTGGKVNGHFEELKHPVGPVRLTWEHF